MKIDFSALELTRLPGFKGGEGELAARMYQDGNEKIMLGHLEPGASIGMHTHETNSETLYVLQGSGRVLYDDGEESLSAGQCHYCPKGHRHSLINSGTEPLEFFAVIPNQ